MKGPTWLYTVVFDIVFAALIWLGYVGDVAGARHVVLLIAIVGVVVGLVLHSGHGQADLVKAVRRDRFPTLPDRLNALIDIAFVLALVWFGAWVPAALLTINCLLASSAVTKARRTVAGPPKPTVDDLRLAERIRTAVVKACIAANTTTVLTTPETARSIAQIIADDRAGWKGDEG